jgi:hypothetical protein
MLVIAGCLAGNQPGKLTIELTIAGSETRLFAPSRPRWQVVKSFILQRLAHQATTARRL